MADEIVPEIVVDPLQYQHERESAFTKLGDQLDMQYWDLVNDTTTWKDAIAAIKTKWPKDNSGPVE